MGDTVAGVSHGKNLSTMDFMHACILALLVLQHVCLFRVDLHIEQSSGKMGPGKLTD